MPDIEREWVDRYGSERVAELRTMLLDITAAPQALASVA
jgi:hypothetical protein